MRNGNDLLLRLFGRCIASLLDCLHSVHPPYWKNVEFTLNSRSAWPVFAKRTHRTVHRFVTAGCRRNARCGTEDPHHMHTSTCSPLILLWTPAPGSFGRPLRSVPCSARRPVVCSPQIHR